MLDATIILRLGLRMNGLFLLVVSFVLLLSPHGAVQTTSKSYIILSNIQSGSNLGSITRNALAFGVSEILVVGRKDFKGKMVTDHGIVLLDVTLT